MPVFRSCRLRKAHRFVWAKSVGFSTQMDTGKKLESGGWWFCFLVDWKVAKDPAKWDTTSSAILTQEPRVVIVEHLY